MATLHARADGNLSATATWALGDATSEMDSETGSTGVSTSTLDSAAFTPAQKAALSFTETAVRQSSLDTSHIAELRRHFSAREIVELAMVIGFYVSTAIFIKVLAVPAEKA